MDADDEPEVLRLPGLGRLGGDGPDGIAEVEIESRVDGSCEGKYMAGTQDHWASVFSDDHSGASKTRDKDAKDRG